MRDRICALMEPMETLFVCTQMDQSLIPTQFYV